jgi:hypothetical protein
LVDHARYNDTDTLTSGFCLVCFQHSANSRRQILNELRNIENRILSLKRELSSREIAKHYVGLAEANIDRDCQTVMSSNVQEGWLAAPSSLTRGAFIDHALCD